MSGPVLPPVTDPDALAMARLDAVRARLAVETDATARHALESERAALLGLPPPVPPAPVVSRFQARAALMQAGLLTAVTDFVAASGDAMLQLAWAEAIEFSRDSPTIVALTGVPPLNLTAEQLDALFAAASQITA